jgi:hypothetical protein
MSKAIPFMKIVKCRFVFMIMSYPKATKASKRLPYSHPSIFLPTAVAIMAPLKMRNRITYFLNAVMNVCYAKLRKEKYDVSVGYHPL